MRTFKTSMASVLLAAIVSLASFTTQAALLFEAGEFKFTGDTYIGGNPTTGIGSNSAGIGRVTTITQGTDIIWTSGTGGEFINFVFGDFLTGTFTPLGGGINFFQASGGFVDFFKTTNASVFNVANDMLPTIAAITSDPLGSLWLATQAHGLTSGTTAPIQYSGNGLLNVTGGSASSMFDTDSRPDGNGGFADLTFGLTGARNQNGLVNDDYFYIASADVQGAVTTVPTPAPLVLLVSGLIGLGFFTPKRKELTSSI